MKNYESSIRSFVQLYDAKGISVENISDVEGRHYRAIINFANDNFITITLSKSYIETEYHKFNKSSFIWDNHSDNYCKQFVLIKLMDDYHLSQQSLKITSYENS